MKKILTVHDIEALQTQGIKEIEVTNDVIVTDVARERAEKLGIRLKRLKGVGGRHSPESDLRHRVRKEILARLGTVPDGLDAMIDQAISETSQGK